MLAVVRAFPAMQHGIHRLGWPGDVPPDNALWLQDHLASAHDAANRSVVIARNSGHVVMNDRPDLVSQAVIAAVNRTGQATPR